MLPARHPIQTQGRLATRATSRLRSTGGNPPRAPAPARCLGSCYVRGKTQRRLSEPTRANLVAGRASGTQFGSRITGRCFLGERDIKRRWVDRDRHARARCAAPPGRRYLAAADAVAAKKVDVCQVALGMTNDEPIFLDANTAPGLPTSLRQRRTAGRLRRCRIRFGRWPR